jgi:hypothetical protein
MCPWLSIFCRESSGAGGGVHDETLEGAVEVGFATIDHGGVHQLAKTLQVVSLATLPSEHSALLDGPISVVLVSRNPNGSSHVSPVWLGRDELYLYLAAYRGQVVDRNLRARPEVSFLLVDPADPYRWMSVSAQVEQVVDDVKGRDALHGEVIDQLGRPAAWAGPVESVGDGWSDGVRTLYRVRPDRLMLFEKRRPAR